MNAIKAKLISRISMLKSYCLTEETYKGKIKESIEYIDYLIEEEAKSGRNEVYLLHSKLRNKVKADPQAFKDQLEKHYKSKGFSAFNSSGRFDISWRN